MAKKITEETLRLNIIINGDSGRKALLDQEQVVRQNTNRLKEMQKELERLGSQGNQNSKKYKKLTESIKKQEDVLKNNKSSLEQMRRQLSLTSMTMDELRHHSNQIRSALVKAVPGTENFKKLRQELQNTRSRMRELEVQSVQTDKTLCGFAQNMRDYVINIKGIKDFAGGLYDWVNQAVSVFREQDEAMTDAMKTTNLTKEEIRALSDELKKIDTRTAQNDLLGLVRIGGKLGVQGSENLLAFARAADKINVALKDDLGGDTEGAIATVGKLVDIFQLEGQFGLEDSLLKVGSAINDLGMASTANEGYIVDFTSRLAGIAPNADISITKILGLGATLDKYGQQAETAGTAIGQTIMAMFKRTETFANIAKMPVKEFADILNKDVNEALLRVLEGMNDGGGLASVVSAMEEMHLNGQRASTILGTLSKNTAELRAQQELAAAAFEKGSSLQEEFNTKNESATAIAEKHKKAIQEQVVVIGEKLLPVANGVMKLAETGLSLISDIIPLMIKSKAAILAVAGAYLSLVAAKKINNAVDAVRNFNFKQWKADAALEVTLLQGSKRSTIALSVAKNILAGNFKAAGAAAKLFGASLKTAMGPIGWATLAIEALLALFSPLIKRFRDQQKLNKELEESNNKLSESYSSVTLEMNKEKSRLDAMKSAVTSAKKGSKERAEAINRINSEYRTYLPNLLTEKSSNEDVAAALYDVNKQLENKIKLQAKEKAMSEVNEKVDTQTMKAMDDFDTLLEKSTGQKTSAAMRDRMNKAVMEYRDAMAKAVTEAQKTQARNKLTSTYFDLGGDQMFFRGNKLRGIIDELNSVIEYSGKATQMLDQLYGKVEAPKINGTTVTTVEGEEIGGFDPVGEDEDKKKIRELKQLVEESKKIITDGNKDLVDAENKRYAEELARFEAQKEKLIAAGVDYNALMLTLEEKHKVNLSKIDVKSLDDSRKAIESNYKLEKAQAQNRHSQELEEAKAKGDDIKTLKERQAKELAAIDAKYATKLQDLLTELQNLDGTINLNIEGLTEEELTAIKIKLEEIKALKNELSGNGTETGTDSETNSNNKSNPAYQKYGTMFGLDSEQWLKFFDDSVDGWEKMTLAVIAFDNAAKDAMSIVSMAMDRQSKMEQKQLKEYKKSNDQKKATLEARLKSGLMTEEQYNNAVEQMDAEYAAHEEELALKQAKREKAMQLTQAIINTAVGVTMALSSMIPPLNFINAGIVAAMGAAEIALIASTPVTTGAEEGGRIFTEREQDGKTYNAKLSPRKRGLISGPTILVGENGSEYVIPHEGLENPTLLPLIENMEVARKNGRLKDLDFRSVYSPAVVSTGFAAGGNTATTVSGNSVQGDNAVNNDTLSSLMPKIDAIIEKLDNPVPAIVSMLGDNGLINSYEKYQRLKKNGRL